MKIEESRQKNEVLKMSNIESNLFTKDCIRTSLLSLLATETFDHITVTSIIKRAGVSRGGFYRNYKSKEEVLQEIGEELFQYILDYITEHKYYVNTKKWYLDLFQTIADNSQGYQLLIGAQVPKSVVIQFDEEKLFKELRRDDSALEKYRAIAIGKALTEIAVVWFKNGMKETPEEMAEIMFKIFFINN